MTDAGKAVRKRRIKLHEVTHENDMRYLGPINYQLFQILGWLCMAAVHAVLFLRLSGRVVPGVAAQTAPLLGILDNIGALSLPFLLIASFAIILNSESGIVFELFKNAAAMLVIFGLSCLGFYRYIVGDLSALLTDPSQALPAVQSVLSLTIPYGFVAYNIFVDLFMCALTMFFLNYTPRRGLKGFWLIPFRLLTALPIAYEVFCTILKLRAANGLVQLPLWVYPLLTVKPPMTFVLFILLALFVKTRELRFRRHGRTHEEYRAFLQTRRNSWGFSVFLAIMIVIVSTVDLFVVIGFGFNQAFQTTVSTLNETMAIEESLQPEVTRSPLSDEIEQSYNARLTAIANSFGKRTTEAVEPSATPEAAPAATETPAEAAPTLTPEEAQLRSRLDEVLDSNMLYQAFNRGANVATAIGWGGSIPLILLAPFVLLFSYTRKPKYPLLSLLIPIVGVGLIILVYLEGVHWLMFQLPFDKIDLAEVLNALGTM